MEDQKQLSPPCPQFFRGQYVKHRLNDLPGMITSKGMLYNGGQCWNVRFDRENYFEELEVWEHEIIPANGKDMP